MKNITITMVSLLALISCVTSKGAVLGGLNKTGVSEAFKTEKTIDLHVAKVQYYRWFQLYERPINHKRIINQMDILAKNIEISSSAGTVKGKKNYPQRLAAFEGWQNAHHVKNIDVTTQKNGILRLEADIDYQNILPNGERKSYAIHYSNQLKKGRGFLPQFTSININSTGDNKKSFTDAYPSNRVKALMHYWLALIEQLDGNVKPFREILTDDFYLNFSTGSQLNSIKKLKEWLNGAPKQLSQSSHYPENFSVKQINENEYEMTVEFDWYGITKDEKKLRVRTLHTWLIVDNVNDRFAKIKRADVTQKEPLRVVE